MSKQSLSDMGEEDRWWPAYVVDCFGLVPAVTDAQLDDIEARFAQNDAIVRTRHAPVIALFTGERVA